MKLKVLLFTNEVISSHLHSLLHNEEFDIVDEVQDENIVLDEISQSHPDIVLIATDNMNITLRACQQIYLLRPKSIPVVLNDENDPTLLRKIMQTGIHYVLPLYGSNDNLAEQLQGIYTNESTRIMAMENTSSSTLKSQLIMVFGTEGGIGRTALAANLAVKLAQKKRKVVLLDYDLQFGDLNVFLGIDSKDNISGLLQEQSNPNADTIRRYLSLHVSGVNVLCCPRSPEYAEGVSVTQTEQIISALRNYYDYVIVDSSRAFNDINLSCFDASSSILFVTGMDIAALRNSKKGLDVLESLNHKRKIKLVIGQEYSGNIKPNDVAKALETPIWASVHYDQKAMVEALNLGIPVVLDAPGCKLSKSYSLIANQLDNTPEAEVGMKKMKMSLFKKR